MIVPTDARAPAHGRHVVVLGGGLAGIAAALDCASAGAAVTLLEVRPRLGGAAYSYEREGMTLDNGQHVFLRCCVDYRALLDRLGVSDRVTLQPRLDIPVLAPGGRSARLRRNGLPAPFHLAGALVRYGLIPLRDRLAVAVAMAALSRVDPDDPAADARSFGDWLRSHGQRAAAVESVWRLIALPTLNLEPAQASLAQAAQVFQVGLLSDPGAGDVGWARVPLSELHDEPAQRALEQAGARVLLRTRAERVIVREGGFVVEVEADDEALHADAVVVALPPERAAAVLPPQARVETARLIALGQSPIVNLHAHYGKRVTEEPFAAAVDSPVQWVFDRTATAGVDHGQVLAVSLSAADEEMAMDAEALQRRFVPALGALLPRARQAPLEKFLVVREHAATFRAAPGAVALRPPARTALPALTLAGAWTATGWPATMEGAVRSGHAAAAEALAALAPAHDSTSPLTETLA
ncbi:MAG TPA: hydroxysqualene dehydroxylase HpnE [Conexibacter sp.]|jgi:squalene-associated FAD-dependent desaturase